ncbi:hypothetical protein CEXT_743951 [Caerostris extrusa]|uniref:DUF4817 domain-containing protein n=1 Tax=Caerostris extrusa TaxID=172846 RepID=A0AAV4QSL6_CAEEX|nr:hypothetical protein CEXT_743951 [Caerostris extrusa]
MDNLFPVSVISHSRTVEPKIGIPREFNICRNYSRLQSSVFTMEAWFSVSCQLAIVKRFVLKYGFKPNAECVPRGIKSLMHQKHARNV